MKDDKDFEDEHSTADDGDERQNTARPAEDSSKGAISADLIRGHINTIILRTLDERDKYGYEIINEIEDKSHGQYTLKQPTLYSALKRLETQGVHKGLLEDRRSFFGRPQKVLYAYRTRKRIFGEESSRMGIFKDSHRLAHFRPFFRFLPTRPHSR